MKKVAVKRTKGSVGKKAKATFKPGTLMPELDVPDTHTPRWVRNDPKNVSRKLEEGWEFCSKTKYSLKGFEDEDLRSHENSTSGGVKINEMIGMMLRKDMAVARKKYYEDETAEATKAAVLHDGTKRRLGSRAADGIKTTVDGLTIID